LGVFLGAYKKRGNYNYLNLLKLIEDFVSGPSTNLVRIFARWPAVIGNSEKLPAATGVRVVDEQTPAVTY
jgi:hypothetical protein